MKKYLSVIFLILIISTNIISQDLKLGPNGVKEPVVFEFNLTKSEIYKKSLNWVQETYKNPKEVLRANIENEKIRINGYAINAWWNKSLGVKFTYNIDYTVQIEFKEGRCRFTYTIDQMYTSDGQRLLYTCKAFFKPNGDIKKSYIPSVPSLEKTINDLAISYKNYVSGANEKNEDNW
tara:strand:- start:713 stop:1246 length:534 start_codon:yes stop_codon:yes gene_type:complete